MGRVSRKADTGSAGPGAADPRSDVERELDAHIALRADELRSEGWEARAALEEARRLFGTRGPVADECVEIAARHQRATRRAQLLDSWWQDVRYGLRALRREPTFAIVAVVTLALGVGANTAVFSVVNGVLLRPLPYPEPSSLVWALESRTRGGSMAVAWPNFVDWHAESESFAGLTAYGIGSTTVLGGERAVTVPVANVTADFWSVFGVVPVQGRLPTAADHTEGASPVFVVSRSFWANELGGEPLGDLAIEAVGFDGQVVGILPDAFAFPPGARVWRPLELAPGSTSRTAHNWLVVGRLAPGISVEVAREELDAVTRRIVLREAADPEYLAAGASVGSLHGRIVEDVRRPLLLLLAAAGLVLVVACTNLASMLLARGTRRLREFAVRSALGAGQKRIVRQLLTESLMIALAGGGAGIILGTAMVAGVRRLGTVTVPRLEEVALDPGVLAYSLLLTAVTVAIFAAVPSIRLSRTDPADALRAGTRGNADDHRGVVWRLLVGTEVALALVLLVGSGLLVRSLQEVLAEDPGFDATDVLTAPMALSLAKYDSPSEHAAWYAELSDQLAAVPGVRSAGLLSTLPITGSLPTGRLEVDNDLSQTVDAVAYVLASGSALEALDVRLLAGRLFDGRDGPEAEHVAIVSESFAERFWPGQEPIGRSVSGGGMDDLYEARPFSTVVGVVGDVRFEDLAVAGIPTVYFAYRQRPFRIQYGATLVVESSLGSPGATAPQVRATIARMDPDVPIDLADYEQRIGASLAERRFTTLLLGAFSLIALALATIGIYGVVTYSVARRTREMGIRIALGASAGSVAGIVVTSALKLVSGGLVMGTLVALAGSRVLASLLHGVSPSDPATFAGVVVLLAATAMAASWLPARAGTRVDPLRAMKVE